MAETSVTRHRLGVVALVVGVFLLVIGLVAVFTVEEAGGDPDVTTATLNPSHEGATNPGFQAEDDERCPAGQWGWHFVMPTSDTDFLSLTATFATDGDVAASAFYSAGGQVKHAYVFTSGPDTLLTATAQVDGPGTQFNLSHVCVGTTTTTTTTTASTTTSTTTTTIVTPSVTSSTVSPTTQTTTPTTVPTASSVSPSTLTTTPTGSSVTPVTEVAAAQEADEGVLARTGADTGWPIVVGLLLMAGGGALVWTARRQEA